MAKQVENAVAEAGKESFDICCWLSSDLRLATSGSIVSLDFLELQLKRRICSSKAVASIFNFSKGIKPLGCSLAIKA